MTTTELAKTEHDAASVEPQALTKPQAEALQKKIRSSAIV